MTKSNKQLHFVVCVGNQGYRASLEVRKIYDVVPDADAERLQQIRVINESGEDYLFPREYFLPIQLPKDVEAALRRTT